MGKRGARDALPPRRPELRVPFRRRPQRLHCRIPLDPRRAHAHVGHMLTSDDLDHLLRRSSHRSQSTSETGSKPNVPRRR